jgi:DNA repair exonuclease SbcCD ATPase subunit
MLIQEITTLYQRMFDDTDELVEDILGEARKLADANRGEVQKVRGNMADLDRKIEPLMRLLADPNIDVMAKKAISRQIGELESERERLTALSVELAQQASEDTEQLAEAVHQALAEARENLALATTPTKLRDFIEEFVGPMVLKTDGTITRKETPPSEGAEGGVTRPLAGVHSWPLHIRNTFWQSWCVAA